MLSTRTSAVTLLLGLAALPGCDTILGPPSDPASIEVSVDRDTVDMVGTTVLLEAVVRNEDGDVLSDAAVTWSTRDSTVATIAASGLLTARATGETWVIGQSGNAIDSTAIIVDSPIPCLPTGDLTVPDTVNDTLVPGDCGPEARYAEVWRLELSEARTITIDLISSEFNTYLFLLNAGGQIIGADNDGGVAFNSRLLIDLPAGVYYPVVAPYSSGASGAYQLTTMEGAHPSPCPATDTVMFPDTVTGATTTGSCDYQGFYIDAWRLELADTSTVTMELVGDGFGMYMAVTDTLGQWLTSGGDGRSSGAWLEVELPPGSYDLWAGAREPAVTGSYTLAVRRGPAAVYCPGAGSIGVNESVPGEITDEDCYSWYAPSDGWELVLTDTVALDLSVNSADAMYPAIIVTDSTGEIVNVAFDEHESYVRADTTMLPGRYRVWVQSADLVPGEYRLSVVEQGRMGACDPVGALALDSTYEGALSTTDCSLIDGRFTDVWTLQIDSATTAAFDLTSDKFDAFLIVTDTAGNQVGRDDDSGDGTNAAITLDFEPGLYHLWVTSYFPRTIGGYELATSMGATALADGADTQTSAAGKDRTDADAGERLWRWRTALTPYHGGDVPAWAPGTIRSDLQPDRGATLPDQRPRGWLRYLRLPDGR